MIKIDFTRIRQKFNDLSLDLVLPVFLLNLMLEMAHFFPDLREINIWDEATYIQNGVRLLSQGSLPDLAGSPLSSLLFAITTLPVYKSPDFFVMGDAIARIFLFTFIFFSAYLIARALKPYIQPWVMVGFVFIIPVATTMFLFPSDALFAGFSGLAFWQMLRFYNDRERKHLWWASTFIGLGMLARAEGLLLVGVMLIVTLIIILPNRNWYREVIAILLPFIILVGGYILVYGLSTGNFGTGLPERTFNNFESGHEVIYSQTGVFTPTISARIESREVFGTPEENNLSVFKAILRNPQVYALRFKKAVPTFVSFAIKAYGNKFILIFIALSIRGLVALIQKKHLPLVWMTVLWFVPLGVGFLNTFFREGYFIMPYFVVFALSSIGLTTIIENFNSRAERLSLVIGSGMILLIGLLAKNTSMVYRNALFIFCLGFVYLLWKRYRQSAIWHERALWVLLAAGLIIRGGYSSPEVPVYGQSDLEQSVYVLQEVLQPESNVLAGAPANIWAARMTYYGINSYDIPGFDDESEFLEWLRVQDIDAIYVDLHFPAAFRVLTTALVDQGLSEVYATPESDILIYLVNGSSDD